MVSHAAWSPLRQRSMRESISCGAGVAASAVIRDVRERRWRECAHDNMRFARVLNRFSRQVTRLPATASASNRSSNTRARRPTSTARARSATRIGAIDDAFASYPHAIHYALKANSTLAIVRLLRSLGSRADANSGGEIRVAERAGFAPQDIVFTGVGKTRDELEYAVAAGVGDDQRRIGRRARSHRGNRACAGPRGARRAARQSRHRSPGAIRTSRPASRRTSSASRCRKRARSTGRGARRTACGLSACTSTSARRSPRSSPSRTRRNRSCRSRSSCAMTASTSNTSISAAGLASRTKDGRSINPADYAGAVIPELRRAGIPVVLEPGRAVVGYSGALVARVVDTKCFPDGRKFAVLDAGMGELIRPALYGSFHRIVPVAMHAGAESAWDIVGPICESSDVFARDRTMPPLEVDDLVAILDAGAYGSVMGSNYNRHLLPAEVLVDEGKWTTIRRRQTLEDVLALET